MKGQRPKTNGNGGLPRGLPIECIARGALGEMLGGLDKRIATLEAQGETILKLLRPMAAALNVDPEGL